MEKYTEEERILISLNRPIENVDESLINSVVDKMLYNNDYENLIYFLNTMYDFAKIPNNLIENLIKDNNKECISIFLENDGILYFLSENEKDKLKKVLDVHEVNIKLEKSYDYYYDLLFKQGFRPYKSIKINDKITEHLFTRYNKLTKIKLKEIDGIGVVGSYINYKYYNLSKTEQILNAIDYINKYGFNIERNINDVSII